jgi:hypothetical protein
MHLRDVVLLQPLLISIFKQASAVLLTEINPEILPGEPAPQTVLDDSLSSQNSLRRSQCCSSQIIADFLG